ncbi:hypothetical protein AnigIFM63326_011527 [Aspergillus niger]|nr:hypothetical protein AnigIFM63326_011527 [Aspergillus niger]
MTENAAAWITAPAEYPFKIQNAAKPKPGPGEVVIKNVAVAINPVDWKIQSLGRYLNQYPFVLGQDAAGFIEDVGSGVTRFKKGQRVIAHCYGLLTQDPAHGAFQLYPVTAESLVAEIPESLTFEQAVVLPLAVSTASAGLYRKDYLNLPFPEADDVKSTDKVLLVWGGASSVGASAIQLAVASGLTVFTTASEANREFVKSLGAHAVFDYRSSTVVEDISRALRGLIFAGVYDAIAEEPSFAAISEIFDTLDTKVPVASVLPCDRPTERFIPQYVIAYSIIQEPHNDIGDWIWGKYLPRALANGAFQVKPDPYVVGHGLKTIQHGLDVQKKGVSAKKVIVTL